MVEIKGVTKATQKDTQEEIQAPPYAWKMGGGGYVFKKYDNVLLDIGPKHKRTGSAGPGEGETEARPTPSHA